MATEILFLSEPDLIRAGVLDAAKCIDVCEEVFSILHEGDYLMGGPNHNEHGLVLVFPKESKFPNMPLAGPERRFIAMPAYLGGRFNVCGEKWYGSNVKNPKERGLPRSVLTVTLNDPESCEPFAFMSGNLISSMRTGCIPGVGVRYMANKDAESVSVIGVGPIQKATMLAMKAELPNLKYVYAKAAHLERAEGFVDWCKEELGLTGEAFDSMEACCKKGDIVSVAASPKDPLYFEDAWFKEGATIIGTSPFEADDAFWLNNPIVFDNTKMHEAYYTEGAELGDVKKACNGWGKMYSLMAAGRLAGLEKQISLGDVVTDPSLGRKDKAAKEIFVTSGQVLFDVAWGKTLYETAKAQGIGQSMPLWDEPYWT